MVRARRQYHQNNHHRHPLNNFYRHKRSHVPNAPSNTTQFIMNDHELIEPDFDLMHNAIMEHYNRSKKRKHQHVVASTTPASAVTAATTTSTETATTTTSPTTTSQSKQLQQQPHQQRYLNQQHLHHQHQQHPCKQQQQQQQQSATPKNSLSPSSRIQSSPQPQEQQPPTQQQQHNHPQNNQQQQQHHQSAATAQTMQQQLQESTKSNPTTPSHRPTGSPGEEDGMSPFINHEHLQSEFQEVYANIHTERLSSMSKNQLVNQYLLLEERVEELENQLRESQTSAGHG